MNENLPQHDDSAAKRRSSGGFPFALVVVGILAIAFAFVFRATMPGGSSAQLNKEFPPLEAMGWLNGPGPTSNDLQNHVVVVDAFAFWCGPCRAALPSLIELHQKYKDRGVTFLGLTSEGSDPDSLQKTREFIEAEKIPWVTGYGAFKPLETLQVDSIPQLWVINRQNRIVLHELGWSFETSPHELDAAIAKALEGGQ